MTTLNTDRLAELLAARTLDDIDESENTELAHLLAEMARAGHVGDDLSYEEAASALQVAYTPMQRMPPALTAKVATLADRFAAEAPGLGTVKAEAPMPLSRSVFQPPAKSAAEVHSIAPRSASARSNARGWVPWLAAAACLALAAFGWLRGGRDHTTQGAGELRTALLKAPGTVILPWSATKDTSGASATGDLVWSESEQKGYMRFQGLAANDPKHEEYQLWIFDKAQDERFPIDGGVFDVDAATGDVIVPIVPKIHVAEATLFAVTVEKPGGVVVSKRERIVVTAAPKAG
jgi:hypothetical protein